MNDLLLHSLRDLEFQKPSPIPDVSLAPVVSVLDDFSERCFSATAGLWPIRPDSEPADLECIRPDFLLVESTWNGNGGAWRSKVTSTRGPHSTLVSLVQNARQCGIPTVFWNKEDPPHFDDFVESATLFDYIFTSEEALVDRYRERAPHAEIGVLKFAASTALHRPELVGGDRAGDVCFAGQYFRHKYPERKEQMDFLFDAAAQFGFTIYSRMLGGIENYAFPEELEKFIVGSLPYLEMVKEYRRHKVFLNVNSVPDSRSMCARRVFELASSKTIVLSATSPAVRSVYAEDEVPMASNSEEAHEILEWLLSDDSARQQMAHRAWRRTAREHTYDHRMQQIRGTLGLDVDRRVETVGLVTPAGLPHEALDRLAGGLLQQNLQPGFIWVWQLDEQSWLSDRQATVRELAAHGIVVASDCDPEWWAAWHPGAIPERHHLQDMLLYASRYTDGRAASAAPNGSAAGSEDSVTGRVWSAGWLAHSESSVVHELLRAARGGTAGYLDTAGTYRVSGVGLREAHYQAGVIS